MSSELPVIAGRQTSDDKVPLTVTLNSVCVSGGGRTGVFAGM